MKTRVIHTKIWKDAYFHQLSDKEARVFMYLFTNDQINMCGVYELHDEEIKLWCQINDEELAGIKEKLQKDNKFIFVEGWVAVINHEKYNNYGNGKLQSKAFTREWEMIPNNIKQHLNTSMIHHINQKLKIINDKPETINGEEVTNLSTTEGYKNFQEARAFLTRSKAIDATKFMKTGEH